MIDGECKKNKKYKGFVCRQGQNQIATKAH
jgi:hypothetical protein